MRHIVQNTVGSVTNAIELFVRLKVNIRCTAIYRVDQHLLHVFHDRRIVDFVWRHAAGIVLRLITRAKINVLQRRIVADHLIESGCRAFAETLDQDRELVFFDDNRLDGEPCRKLELGKQLLVGRIGHRQKQAVSAFQQGNNPLGTDQFGINQRRRKQVRIHRAQVKQRHTKRIGRKQGDLGGRYFFRASQLFNEANAQFAGFTLQSIGVTLDELSLLDQGAGQRTKDIGSGGSHEYARGSRQINEKLDHALTLTLCKESIILPATPLSPRLEMVPSPV